MSESVSTDFLPSKHGFAFRNSWRDPLLGILPGRGRCGGMVFAALDAYSVGVDVPGEGRAEVPRHGSRLSAYIWRRQVGSALAGGGLNLVRFLAWTFLPQRGSVGLTALSANQMDQLFEALEAGLPVPLGLISASEHKRVFRNHQVLAYAAEMLPGRVLISIYDPNHPRRDDIVLDVPLAGDGLTVERVGMRGIPWRGLFAARYTFVTPPGVAPTVAKELAAELRPARRGLPMVLGAVFAVLGFGLIRAFLKRRRSKSS